MGIPRTDEYQLEQESLPLDKSDFSSVSLKDDVDAEQRVRDSERDIKAMKGG
jgi:hypothetical protein